MITIDGPNPDLLVPIYHHSGDLYWPKYVPYAEIKSQQEAQEVTSSQ
jgi:hypothetical protein